MQDGSAVVLIVDDSRVNRMAIDKHLRGEGYILYSACDGEEALELLQKDPDIFDVILLDLIMPKMDGMTLIHRIKDTAGLAHIPIIVQSGCSKEEEIRDAIQAGAFYYLVKPIKKYELVSIVRTAVLDMVQFREQQQALYEPRDVCDLLVSSTFHFKTPEEGFNLAVHLSEQYVHADKVITGIHELFLNAVEHGNVAITYDEKTVLNDENNLSQEVARRLALPEYRDRKVIVTLEKQSDAMVLSVIDEGDGFDWRNYMEVSPERITHNHGRGIAMANLMSFDALQYEGKGNVVRARTLLL